MDYASSDDNPKCTTPSNDRARVLTRNIPIYCQSLTFVNRSSSYGFEKLRKV